MNQTIEIGGVSIEPGTQVTVDLPIPRLYDRTALSIPLRVLHGHRAGPTLLLSSTIHGDEVNGIEIINRVLKLRGAKRLHGTLIAAPVVNVYGLITRARYLPDGRDLNRSFPGSTSGSLTARLANVVMEKVVSKATHVIDMHTGGLHRSNLPHVRFTTSHEPSASMAEAFGAPVILHARPREGSLREAAMARDIAIIVYEAGEALRFSETGIRAGVRGVVRVMRHLGMITGSSTNLTSPFHARGSEWVRAPISGLFRSKFALGGAVTKNQILGSVTDPLGEDAPIPVESPKDGIVIGQSNIPVVHQGDPLLHLAHFDDSHDVVAAEIVDFREEVKSVMRHTDDF